MLEEGENFISKYNDEKLEVVFIKENEGIHNLLGEATRSYKMIAKSLWKYKLIIESKITQKFLIFLNFKIMHIHPGSMEVAAP